MICLLITVASSEISVSGGRSVGWYGGWDLYDGGIEYHWTDPTYLGAPDTYDWSVATTGPEYDTDPSSYDYTVDWDYGDTFVGPESVWYGYDTPYTGIIPQFRR